MLSGIYYKVVSGTLESDFPKTLLWNGASKRQTPFTWALRADPSVESVELPMIIDHALFFSLFGNSVINGVIHGHKRAKPCVRCLVMGRKKFSLANYGWGSPF